MRLSDSRGDRIKHLVLRTMKSAGVVALSARSGWRRQRLLILMYHGVSIHDEHEWDPALYLSQERFRITLGVLRRAKCQVLPLREAVHRLYEGELPARAVALTFDDGDYDFSSREVPVLAEFGYPATVFVSTYYTELQRPVFNPVLSYILWKGRGRKASGEGIAEGDKPLKTKTRHERTNAWLRVYRHAEQKGLSGSEKHEVLASLAARLEVDFDAINESRMFHLMRPDELAALPSDLTDVQLHTHRHRTPQDRDLFHAEIRDNRTALNRALGADRTFDHFCYPGGKCVPEFLPWLEDVGVNVAVTCESRLASRSSHPLMLPRVAVTMWNSQLELECWASGARALLPRVSSV